MTRRQMYQRGEDQNKQTGFWGMIKSVTSTQTGSESILYTVLEYGAKGFNFSLLSLSQDILSVVSVVKP